MADDIVRTARAAALGAGGAGSSPPSCGVHWFAGAGGVTCVPIAGACLAVASPVSTSAIGAGLPEAPGCHPYEVGRAAACRTIVQECPRWLTRTNPTDW